MRFAALGNADVTIEVDVQTGIAHDKLAALQRDMALGVAGARSQLTSLEQQVKTGTVPAIAGLSQTGLTLASVFGVTVLGAIGVVGYGFVKLGREIAGFVADSITYAGQFDSAWTATVERASSSWDSFRRVVGEFFTQSPSLRAAIDSLSGSFASWVSSIDTSRDVMLPFVQLAASVSSILLAIGESAVSSSRSIAVLWSYMPGSAGDFGRDTAVELLRIEDAFRRVRVAIAAATLAASKSFLANSGSNLVPVSGPPNPGAQAGGKGGASQSIEQAVFGQGGMLGFDTAGYATAAESIGAALMTVDEALQPLNLTVNDGQIALASMRSELESTTAIATEFVGPIDSMTASQEALGEAVKMAASAIGQQAGQYLALALAGGKAHLSVGRLLATMSSQMFATALTELAAGIAASTGAWGRAIFGDPAKHFQAAAVFGAAGAALGVASRLAGGPGGEQATATGRGGGRGGATPVDAGSLSPAPQEQSITIYLDGQGVITDMDSFAQSLQDSMDRVNRKRGR